MTPRVQKMWDKLGKQPKKVEIQLLDSAAMDAELAKAKAEKAKAQKKEAANQPAQQQEEKEEEKEMTPEEIAQKEEQINELQGQIGTALERGDKDAANELFKELSPIITKFPDAKKNEWQKKIDEIKQKIGA
ncbi:hypothetical protein KY349_05775 [Candidatus Woesearchaeota archaeon]|nr:hypothetical protein [Candidatus Woesearchaeota archaeon]